MVSENRISSGVSKKGGSKFLSESPIFRAASKATGPSKAMVREFTSKIKCMLVLMSRRAAGGNLLWIYYSPLKRLNYALKLPL